MRARHLVIARVHRAVVFLPNDRAFHVEAEQSLRTEDRDDMLAVGRRSGIAMARLGVAFHAWNSFVPKLVPNHLAGDFVERDQTPLVSHPVVGRIDVAVETDF